MLELYEETSGIDLPVHSIDSLGGNFERLWEISSISATITSNNNNLTASHGKIYLITRGPDENNPTTLSIVAFDGLAGNVMWQISGKF